MEETIYVTHEMVIKTQRFYTRREFKRCKKDFETITAVKSTALEKYIAVEGTVRVYGYKIEGEGYNNGFYDVFNRRLYTKKEIKSATITPYDSTIIQDNSIISRVLRRG